MRKAYDRAGKFRYEVYDTVKIYVYKGDSIGYYKLNTPLPGIAGTTVYCNDTVFGVSPKDTIVSADFAIEQDHGNRAISHIKYTSKKNRELVLGDSTDVYHLDVHQGQWGLGNVNYVIKVSISKKYGVVSSYDRYRDDMSPPSISSYELIGVNY